MIGRYTRPEMGAVWSEQNKLQKWLDVELAALDALAKFKYIPKNIPAQVRKKARFSVEKVKEIERIVKHDVIAFVTNVAQHAGPAGRYIHFGLTSSDVLDTGLALQIKEASVLISGSTRGLLKIIRSLAKKHRLTLCVGRSHGVHAEPTTFGLKMAVFYQEIARCLERFELAAEDIRCGKISGAVGTFANVHPKVEADVCRRLALKADLISTQVIQRDRHAAYLSAIALLGSSLEKLGTEIRNLQRTEILEVQEFFDKGQKGSSAMPHKQNPITCERVAGLSRILRGNAMAAMENVALWHERDITHSSVERVIFPDSTILVHYMLHLMTQVMSQLVVYKKNMLRNLDIGKGMVFSQGFLLALIKKGLTREEAYAIVQDCAKEVWQKGVSLREAVKASPDVRKRLTEKEIEAVLDYRYHTKNVDLILRRALK